jgi:acyl carrier protein
MSPDSVRLLSREQRIAVIRSFVAERLFRKPEEVKLESRLIVDLGADSLDFVDFQFQLERRFGVQFKDRDFFDSSVRWVNKDGFLRHEVVERFGDIMPGLREEPDPDQIPFGHVLNLITVETLLRIVENKLSSGPDSNLGVSSNHA